MLPASWYRYLLPALTEQFRSPLAPAEVLHRVQGSIAPPRPVKWLDFSSDEPAEPFRGTAGESSFELQRIIDYRNSMLPRISGRVAPAGGGRGSRVQVQHQLHPFVLAFAGLWLSIVGFAALAVVGSLLTSGGFSWPALIPVGMLIFGVALFTVPFWLEVRKSRAVLIQLLDLQDEAST